jgi:crossover junction endodeoxyribonuclease RuvC
MVKRLLQLPGVPGQDAADALGLAITHAHSGMALSRWAAAGASTRKVSGMYRQGRSH